MVKSRSSKAKTPKPAEALEASVQQEVEEPTSTSGRPVRVYADGSALIPNVTHFPCEHMDSFVPVIVLEVLVKYGSFGIALQVRWSSVVIRRFSCLYFLINHPVLVS